jgi:hypothetical protein
MRKLFFIYFVFILASFVSCRKENLWDAFKGTGENTTEVRTIAGFNTLYVEDKINVYITQDSVFEVRIEAGSHLIKLIKIELKDSILKIRNDNKCDFTRSYKKGTVNVFIKMPSIAGIEQHGQGTIQSLNTLTTPVIDILTKGSGDVILRVNNKKIITHLHNTSDIYLSGKTNEHACYQIHYGYMYAQNLDTDYTWILNNGSGNAYLTARNLLIVTLLSTGDVYYYGSPGSVQQKISGKGRLIPQ